MRVPGPWPAAIAALAVASLAASGAAAQTVDIQENAVTRKNSDRFNDAVALRFYVGRDDCTSEDVLTFPVVVSGAPAGSDVEVWMAIDGQATCWAAVDRDKEGSKCRALARDLPTTTKSIEIAAADIAGQLENVSGCDDTGSVRAPRPVILYFMVLPASGDAVPSESGTWTDTKVDLLGPPPPAGFRLEVGEGRLIGRWDAPAAEDDVAGYRLYCDDGTCPAAGSAAACPPLPASEPGDAGTDGGASDAGDDGAPDAATDAAVADATADASPADAGEGGTEAGAGPCASSYLKGGAPPPAHVPPLACGALDQAATEAETTPLENFRPYVVAVAAVDLVGNIGPLSDTGCAAPQPVDDFFKLYVEAGGKAGGGFCSAEPSAAPARSAAVVAVALVALLLATRRRPAKGRAS